MKTDWRGFFSYEVLENPFGIGRAKHDRVRIPCCWTFYFSLNLMKSKIIIEKHVVGHKKTSHNGKLDELSSFNYIQLFLFHSENNFKYNYS